MGIFIGAFIGGWFCSFLVFKFAPQWLAFLILGATMWVTVTESPNPFLVAVGGFLGIAFQVMRNIGRQQRLSGAEIGVGLLGLFFGYQASKMLSDD